MAEQTVGYVELEWRCPSCGNRNPGSVKKCAQCGAALTEEVQFEQAPQETIIADEAKIAAADGGRRHPMRLLRHRQFGHGHEVQAMRRRSG